MGLIVTFLYGALGSAAVEVIAWIHACDRLPQQLPRRYKQWTFWFSRIILACLAGGLAVAYNIQAPVLAINVGASAPLLYRMLAKGLHQHQ